MAATRASCAGEGTTRVTTASRLGSQSATGYADTYRTFTLCHVRRDGSGYVRVTRDGKVLHSYDFEAE